VTFCFGGGCWGCCCATGKGMRVGGMATGSRLGAAGISARVIAGVDSAASRVA